MKKIVLVTVLLTLCTVLSFAQTTEQDVKQLPSIKKQLDLKYLGNDSSSVLNRIYRNDVPVNYLQKQKEASAQLKNVEHFKTEMPIMRLDSSIHFHALASVPDSTTLFHIRIKKPEKRTK